MILSPALVALGSRYLSQGRVSSVAEHDPPFQPFSDTWLDVPIWQSFQRVAREHRGRTAVRDGGTALSYGALAAAAGRVRAAVEAVPARSGAIGLLLPNTVLHPVAALACIAAARIYAPFDISYPAGRNAGLIAAACLDAVIVGDAGGELLRQLPPDLPRIDISACLGGPEPAAMEAAPVSPDAAAVILHTSGSTGRPKAVVVSHASLLHRVLHHVNASEIGRLDQLCPLSSPCTISGIREQLAALLTGATLHAVDPHRCSLPALRAAFRERRISITYAVPALLRALAQAPGAAEDLASLRVVRLGGDTVLWRDIAGLRAALPAGCRIQIGFSSTESPGMQWFVPHGFPAHGAAVPLGQLLPGLRAELRGRTGAAVTAGETGELVIRSRFTALGLWQEGCCVPGPFAADPEETGARVNASGDLVQLRPDGLFAYAGRSDRQIKIRGQRVDPVEAEAALLGVAGVAEAAVIADAEADPAGLAAFIAAVPGSGPQVEREARRALRFLPAAARPAMLHVVTELPRLPSAKPDLGALRRIDRARRQARAAAASARSGAEGVEHLVAQAWHEVLGREVPGGGAAGAGERWTGETWSQAGGDSLRLMQLAALLEQRVGRELPPAVFDGDKTARAIAAAIRDAAPQAGRGGAPADGAPPVFFFPGIGNDGLLQARFRRLLCRQARFEAVSYPDWRSVICGGGGFERFVELSCARIIDAPPEAEVRLAGYSFGAIVALALAQRLLAAGRRVAWLAVFDTDLDWFAGSPELGGWSRAKLMQHLEQLHAAGCSRAALRPLAKAMLGLTVRPVCGWLTERRRFRLPPQAAALALYLAPHLAPHLAPATELRLERRVRLDMAAAWLHRNRLAAAALPIVLFRSDEHAGAEIPDMGWSRAGHPVSVHPVPGDHASMFRSPNIGALAASFALACLTNMAG